jgi:hypothetical protein
MTYKKHGIYQRNLQQLPKQLRKEITKLEKQLKNTDRNTATGRRKYNKLHTLLENKKMKADNQRPDWRKTHPKLQTQ